MHSRMLFSTLGDNPLLLLKNNFIYLLIFGCWISVALRAFLWLRRAGVLSAAVHGLLLVVAPLVVEHRP